MRKPLIAILICLVLVPSLASASFVHRVEVQDDDARVTSVIGLNSPEESGRWQTEMSIEMPNRTDMLRVEDGENNLSFDFEDGELFFTTDPTDEDEERVKITYLVRDIREEQFSDLDLIEMNLPGFQGERTKARVEADDVISWYTPPGFSSQRANGSMLFSGDEAFSLRLYSSDGGRDSENYRYFGDVDLNRTENMFPILSFLTGIESPHEKYALVFLDDERYDRNINDWSSGVYRTGGLIVVRRDLPEVELTSTVLHETMHGFNEEVLKWDRTQTAYYDEGMAKFLEYLVHNKLVKKQAEVFGDRVYLEENGSRYYLEPRSSHDQLWDYYTSDENWIKRWNPYQESSSERRRFGYALSELIIRKHVQENGIDGLREVSQDLLEEDRSVDMWEEKAMILSQHLDLSPCYSHPRSQFEDCLEEINNQNITLDGLDLDVEPIRSQDQEEEINITERDFELPPEEKTRTERLINKFKEIVDRVIRWISAML
ncbi:MAG: hypothetical protein ACLFS3_03040 [Candidatus Aenigmatarchaeota archaeon]